MAIIKSGNFSFSEPPLKNGDVVEGGNFSQLVPHTEICKGVTKITINGGNFVNCKPQDDWIINGGNWCQKEYCTNELPELIERGLTPCAVDCKHRSDEKIERVVDEDEFRKKKVEAKNAQLPILDNDLAIEKKVDADGVTSQTFKVSEYEYKQSIVSTGGKIRKRTFTYPVIKGVK